MKELYIAPEAELLRLAAKECLATKDLELDDERVVVSDNDIEIEIP